MIDLTQPLSDPEFWAAMNTPVRDRSENPYPVAVEGHDQWGRKMSDEHRRVLNSAWERARSRKIANRRRARVALRGLVGAIALTVLIIGAMTLLPGAL